MSHTIKTHWKQIMETQGQSKTPTQREILRAHTNGNRIFAFCFIIKNMTSHKFGVQLASP